MAAIAKEDFDTFIEEFRGLQVQVTDQSKTIKRFIDGLTHTEGSLNEKPQARLVEAVREMRNRADIGKDMSTIAIQDDINNIAHLNLGRVLGDLIRHTNTILDATIVPVAENETQTETFLGIFRMFRQCKQFAPDF